MIGVDTLSWNILIRLSSEDIWREIILEIINKFDIFITKAVLSEFEYRFPDNSWLLDDVIILRDLIEDAEHFRLRGFDEADISLLLYARNKGNWIITEDYGMLTEAMI